MNKEHLKEMQENPARFLINYFKTRTPALVTSDRRLAFERLDTILDEEPGTKNFPSISFFQVKPSKNGETEKTFFERFESALLLADSQEAELILAPLRKLAIRIDKQNSKTTISQIEEIPTEIHNNPAKYLYDLLVALKIPFENSSASHIDTAFYLLFKRIKPEPLLVDSYTELTYFHDVLKRSEIYAGNFETSPVKAEQRTRQELKTLARPLEKTLKQIIDHFNQRKKGKKTIPKETLEHIKNSLERLFSSLQETDIDSPLRHQLLILIKAALHAIDEYQVYGNKGLKKNILSIALEIEELKTISPKVPKAIAAKLSIFETTLHQIDQLTAKASNGMLLLQNILTHAGPVIEAVKRLIQ